MIDFDKPKGEMISDILRETCLSFGILYIVEYDQKGDKFDTHWTAHFMYKGKSKEVPLYIEDSILRRDAATLEKRVLTSINTAMYSMIPPEGHHD